MTDWGRTYTTELTGDGHLRIRRRDGQPVRCQWDVLQRIKNDVMGKDVVAVEVFPRAEDLVNEQNTRHLWAVLDHPGWHRDGAGFRRNMYP